MIDEYNQPESGVTTGHAAVGFVVGQRRDDGTKPEKVVIHYERNGTTDTTAVYRTSGTAEATTGDTVRFDRARLRASEPETITVDAILGAKPA